jgi:hypothetical protein
MDSRKWFERMDWAGACAFCLALGVGISMVVAIVGVVTQDQVVSEQGAQFLSTLFGAAIGALATYLGMARQQQQAAQRSRRSDREDEQK